MCGLISGSSILFHLSTYLFFVNTNLFSLLKFYKRLMAGMVIPLEVHLLRIVLVILDFFHMKFSIVL